jgi:hypothetical protein
MPTKIECPVCDVPFINGTCNECDDLVEGLKDICFRCNKEYKKDESKYICGYDKCNDCCAGECLHRNYPNPNYKN